MCKHTQRVGGRAICGTPISHYQDNLKNRRRFRLRLCTATEREVLDAVIQRGKPEPPPRRWILHLAASCGIRLSTAVDRPDARAGAGVQGRVPYIDRVLEDKFANKVEAILKLAVKRGSIAASQVFPPAGPARHPQLGKTAGDVVSVNANANDDTMTMDRSLDLRGDDTAGMVDKLGGKGREKRKKIKKVAAGQRRGDAIDALIDGLWDKMRL
ncbi:hypothetical protein EsH8_XIV_000020 [Colletotrichum jinshuiense]